MNNTVAAALILGAVIIGGAIVWSKTDVRCWKIFGYTDCIVTTTK